ncbi:MAG: type II toxin-antitoxin system PemK/MazF family toxin [Pyrinomonadaceae bacterium]|nr:type II toxin-antitoxin system PemK/MazF family toxin [Pyrinomonadaceae bacterium]MBP6211421.1 type II toxin-antitoxin system PemK/MazF family toxin [Pyrinomonadaceae bacterium]
MVSRFDVYLVNLDTEVTKNARNTRPCVVLSPDELNRNLSNVIVAPLSSSTAKYPTRIAVNFLNNERMIVLDQLRTVDTARLVKKIGEVERSAHKETLDKLQEMFAE